MSANTVKTSKKEGEKGTPKIELKELISLIHSPFNSRAGIELVTKAYNFAKRAHKDHKRNSGDPYFIHLFETAKTLAEFGMGPQTIAAGLLHDSIEDVGVDSKEIEKKFGKEILHMVEGVTKLGTLKYRGLSRHTESLRKLFVATSRDIRVLLIKLADRLHNMETLDYVPAPKRKRIALETFEIYIPIADRLGMGRLKRQLEDLAFTYVQPKRYQEIKELLKQQRKDTTKHLDKVQKTLKKELARNDITDFSTECRIKGLYSLSEKLKRKEGDITKVHDISALRIIVPTVSDCYKVLGIIHNAWRPLPGELKDYIAVPKPNGYRSIHTKIFTRDGGITEIQIRTKRMHNEAQFGIAAHFSYKEGIKRPLINSKLIWITSLLPKHLRLTKGNEKEEDKEKSLAQDTPFWIKQMAEAQEDVTQPDDFMRNLKSDFFSRRVFVFTPKGDVIDLPIDSSPIDFAYSIHTDIGDHLSSVKVNGKLVSLDTGLKNGDIVEILTKEKSSPTGKWLEIVKTSAAKHHIKLALQHKNA